MIKVTGVPRYTNTMGNGLPPEFEYKDGVNYQIDTDKGLLTVVDDRNIRIATFAPGHWSSVEYTPNG